MSLGISPSGRVAVAAMLSMTMAVAQGCRAARPGESQDVVPELKLEGVRFRVHRGDTLRLRGEAGAVSLRRDSTELQAVALAATLPHPGGDVRISAPAGRGTVSSRTYAASGGVTVSRGADVFRTARARWEPGVGGGLLVGDDPVVVEGNGYRLEGTGFRLDPSRSEIVLRGEARLVAGRGVRR